jgi:hypothetical protein
MRRPRCGEDRTAIRVGDEVGEGAGVRELALALVPGSIAGGVHTVTMPLLVAQPI